MRIAVTRDGVNRGRFKQVYGTANMGLKVGQITERASRASRFLCVDVIVLEPVE
jgi:hypothetical protein